MSTKRGQVWFLDFMVGILIFVATISIYFSVRESSSDTRQAYLDDMIARSKLATEDLMSIGYPDDWNSTNVTRLGLIDTSGAFNVTKIERFYALDTLTARSKLGLGTFHFFAYLQHPNGSVYDFSGANETGEVPSAESIVVQTTRLGAYNHSFAQIKFLTWVEP